MTLGGLAVAVGTRRRRRDRRPREHLPPPRPGRGPPDGVDQRAEGGRGRDHRGDGHDGRRVPAARLRRRHRVPAVPAVRAHGHVRAAGLAAVRADRRPGPRLPARRQGARSTSTRTASPPTRCGSGPTRRRSRPRSAAAGPSSGVVGAAVVLFVATGLLVTQLPDHVHQRGRREHGPGDDRTARGHELRGRPRPGDRGRGRSSSRTTTSSRSRRPSRARAMPASRPIVAAQSGRPANSATLFVRLADDVDLTELRDHAVGVARPGQDRRLRRRGRADRRLQLERPQRHRRPATTRRQVAVANDAVLAALSDNTDLLNLKSDLSKGTPEIQVTPDPNKSIMVGLTGRPGRPGGPQRARRHRRDPRRHRRGRHDHRHLRPARPGDHRLGRRPPRAARSAPSSRCRWATSPRSSRSTPRGRSPASTRRPRPRSPRRSPTVDTGKVSADGPGGDRRARRLGRDPAGRRGVGSPASRSSRPRPSRGCTSRWRSPSSWSTSRWC